MLIVLDVTRMYSLKTVGKGFNQAEGRTVEWSALEGQLESFGITLSDSVYSS